MNAVRDLANDPALDAALVASLFAVDPHGVGGVCLRSPPQAARSQWLQLVRDLLPASLPLRRVPCNISDGRLLGGLDLAATLSANRPMAESGVLALSNGGAIVVSMAERLTPHTTASLNQVLDRGEVMIAREGVRLSDAARVGVVALDEGIADDEFVPRSLADRLAFLLDLSPLARAELLPLHDAQDIIDARALLPTVELDDAVVKALCAAALGLGAGSPRVTLLAIRVAKVSAALDGRARVAEEDAVVAARLVLAPRASIQPADESVEETPAEAMDEPPREPPHEPPRDADEASPESEPPGADERLEDRVLAAAQSAIPAGLLSRLRSATALRAASSRSHTVGRAGALRGGGARGRPAGIRSGKSRTARLNLLETLRAAAPWQRLRGRTLQADTRVRISPDDFRVTRFRQKSQTLTIFAVDASGSSALSRLAETKGAVELLLADCYIRRDQVAVIAFRGRRAELLLPPTRSLVRAKRSLAALPGGGGTPVAAAIDFAILLGSQARRRGEHATVVMLTDGRANVARNGATGREAGQADARLAAQDLRLAGLDALLIDTSANPHPAARELAFHMGATYVPLPFANAQSLSTVVTAAQNPRR